MENSKKESDLLTTQEVADRLKIKPSTVRKLALAKKIPVIKIGVKLSRFLVSDVEEYIKKNRS